MGCNGCANRMQNLVRNRWQYVNTTLPDGSRRVGWCPKSESAAQTAWFISEEDTEQRHFRSLLRFLQFELGGLISWHSVETIG